MSLSELLSSDEENDVEVESEDVEVVDSFVEVDDTLESLLLEEVGQVNIEKRRPKSKTGYFI